MHRGLLLASVVAAGALGAWWALRPPRAERPAQAQPSDAADSLTWVDEAGCGSCHAAQAGAWRGSHHHLAMQDATEAAVRGAFDGRTLASDAETSRFHRSEGAYWIHTPGPSGEAADQRVAYTIGVEPLQQLLLRMEDGRLQAHGAAWDVPEGRWFHLYDGEGVDHRHRLHWSGAQQNADFMCVECHTTGFRRGYDEETGTYASTWTALGVGCQSCHGPASGHLRWVDAGARGGEGDAGFAGRLRAGSGQELATCAQCHSRRTPLGNGAVPGGELLDDYLPMILTAELYEVDGKIKGEVFEYGSFRQSRMHAAGVACTDCHDPHTATLRAEGNAVCTQCHNPAGAPARAGIDAGGLQAKDYEDPSHHHHAAASPGSQCVSCHMPGKLYMGNDLRHDHSFSSPHPMQARALSHGDACLSCHGAEEAEAVTSQFQAWYPAAAPRDGGYARDLHAARQGQVGAAAGLLRQLAREDLPDIRRATLLSELPNYPSAAAQRVLVAALADPSPLVRRTAAELVGGLLPPPQRIRLLGPLLRDPVRAVRLAASWELLQIPPGPGAEASTRQALIAEYEQSQRTMLDRAESQYNLAGLYQATGRPAQVEAALRRALRQDASFSPARIQLAQWRELVENDGEGAERLLREGLEAHPEDASLHHALGLMRVRQGRRADALDALRHAHELAPEVPDYGHIYAVALHDSGEAPAAREVLRAASRRNPASRALRLALIGYLRAAGLQAEADAELEALAARNPDDPIVGSRPGDSIPSSNQPQGGDYRATQ